MAARSMIRLATVQWGLGLWLGIASLGWAMQGTAEAAQTGTTEGTSPQTQHAALHPTQQTEPALAEELDQLALLEPGELKLRLPERIPDVWDEFFYDEPSGQEQEQEQEQEPSDSDTP